MPRSTLPTPPEVAGIARRHVDRGGRYVRVADPGWADPLDAGFSARSGGRWNAPGSFGVLYLNATRGVARANVSRLYDGQPYGPEDLDPATAPVLVEVDIDEDAYVDAISDKGLAALGLPQSYPHDGTRGIVPHTVCQPLGAAVFADGEPGIAVRSAAPGAVGEELAWFAHPERLGPRPARTLPFDEWFWHG